jgi:hydrogenase expression/formation protein HypC
MNFENDESRLLFLKYALPCADTLVERGFVTQKSIRELIKNISLNKEIKEHPEKIFRTANFMCGKIARRIGKKCIDKNIIRRYFLFEHDKVVDSKYKLFKDFNSMQCRIFSGKIIKVKNKEALVQTIIGSKEYKIDFIPNLKIGDYVVVHRNFIVEKINESVFKKLWKFKENYFKSNS